MPHPQLSLGLALPTSWAREDFLVADSNAAALATIERWPDWPLGAVGQCLVLHGPAGSGKTHLAHVWAGLSGARLVGPEAVTTAAVDDLARQPLAVDDADRVADPAALFHLVNLMRERGHGLLLTGARAPALWPYRLPDLMSRLKAMPSAGIDEPDDALLAAVLVKLFSDRQLQIGEGLVTYLVPRIERSFHAARHWAAALDAAALAENRAVTMALARRLLEQQAD
jgi:chromosomal replication initiation ATPase DnaA